MTLGRNNKMVYPLYLIILAVAPGLIWLFYFLRKDLHPEPRQMILKIFLLGMISALPAAMIEVVLQTIFPEEKNFFFLASWRHYLAPFLTAVLSVALVEEFLKYLTVRLGALRHPELDEPVDIILYMIIAGLGFATLENIFIFLSPDIFSYTLEETLSLALFRFISATFLHALCSGTIGFFVALSFCEIKRKWLILTPGFLVAISLHGLYNFSIMNLEGVLRFGVPSIVILFLAIFVSLGIKKLKSLKSICKIS